VAYNLPRYKKGAKSALWNIKEDDAIIKNNVKFSQNSIREKYVISNSKVVKFWHTLISVTFTWFY